MSKDYLSKDGLLYLWTLLKAKFNSKQDTITDLATIRTNASTGANLKTKVDGIAANAQVNVIESVSVNGTNLSVTNKNVNVTVPTNVSELTNDKGYLTSHQSLADYPTKTELTANHYTKTEIDTKLTSAMRYKGSVNTYSELPNSGNSVGDFYNVTDTGNNYAWDGTKWDETGSVVDLTPYMKTADLVEISNAEIDTIVAS